MASRRRCRSSKHPRVHPWPLLQAAADGRSSWKLSRKGGPELPQWIADSDRCWGRHLNVLALLLFHGAPNQQVYSMRIAAWSCIPWGSLIGTRDNASTLEVAVVPPSLYLITTASGSSFCNSAMRSLTFILASMSAASLV